jgi:hypothetical protein
MCEREDMEFEVGTRTSEESMLITIRFTDAKGVARDTHRWHICGLISGIGEREHHVDDGFATSPGTDVNPTCSSLRTPSPRIRADLLPFALKEPEHYSAN